jgi:hypothetical protein
VEPKVFRGIGVARGAVRLTALVVSYVGAFAVLWGLGLVVRGWQGWTLVTAPLLTMIAARLWAWRRVSVEVNAGLLRYEGAAPDRDFEIPIQRIVATYFDRTLPDRPLVLVTSDGDERICGELSPQAARLLHQHLAALNIPSVRGAMPSTA